MGSIAVANLGIAQGVVASLGTVMIVGLGFLQRPSRASLLWSLAFILAMVSTWVTLAGEALSVEALRRAGIGLMLSSPTLIWSGFRARRRVRALPWIAVVQSALAAAVLIVLTEPVAYSMGFRAVFFVASIFAALTVVEIRRSADRHERLVIPLSLVSAVFFVLGVFTVLAGLIAPAAESSDLTLVRLLNALGMLIYLVCATVTLLYFTSVSTVGAQTARSWTQFTVVASDRLARARAAGETSWVLLSVQIDDPEEIRAAGGEASFGRIVERFERSVVASFPAEADIGREGQGRLVVVLSRPGPVVREHMRETLRRVASIDAAQQISVQLSASVGWAPADVVGYDFATLLAAAQQASEQASELGGDRWQRIGA
ncbi:hypothetical protein ACFXP7_13675 [Microbacterium sp. P06]|uniref:hypothetical protein n=1 Tax=unclassified Microbacterium TaxID=2609290 RepID=UPI003746D7C0